jgi:hypothetical protein
MVEILQIDFIRLFHPLNYPDRFYTPLSSPELSRQSSVASSVASFASADDGEQDCPICLDRLRYYNNRRYMPSRSLYTTMCDHEFHFDCAKRHFSNDNRCPICRREIDDFMVDRPLPQYPNNDIDDLERRLQNLMNLEQNDRNMETIADDLDARFRELTQLNNQVIVPDNRAYELELDANNNDIFVDEYGDDAF